MEKINKRITKENKEKMSEKLSYMTDRKDVKGLKRIFYFVKDLLEKVNDDEAMPYAYQLAYSLLMSIFPFLIFLLTLVGFLHLDSERILSTLGRVLPNDLFNMIEGLLTDIMKKQSGSLLSISVVLAIWSASGGFKAFINALNKIHNLDENRSAIRITIESVVYVLVFALAIVLSLLLFVFGNQLFQFFTKMLPSVNFNIFKSALAFIGPLILVFLLFIIFYMFVPSRKFKFKNELPGAFIASIAFMAATTGFKIYVNSYANYSRFYGAMGTVIVLMVWLLLISMIMVFGAEINSLLIIQRDINNPYIKHLRKRSEFKKLKKELDKITDEDLSFEAKELEKKMEKDIYDDILRKDLKEIEIENSLSKKEKAKLVKQKDDQEIVKFR